MAKYDVAIIGSGPGGYVAAIRAGELGLKTIVVEKDPFLGGTCLHVGCIPTKVLLHHADVYEHFKNGAELGFEVSGLKVNWANIIARKEKIVKKHAKGIEFLFKKNKVEWVQGWGRYEGPGKVSVEKDGKKTQIEASNILMVSGSEARSLPGIEPDHKTILTNRSILELPAIPKTLIIVGAGAVGVEFASIYNSFGTQVTILEALPRVVPVEDEEISAELDKTFRKKNIQIFTQSMVESVKKDAKGVTVAFKDKDGKAQTLQAEKLLLAVGRKPMTDNCGIEKSKAKLERGFVHVGPYMETDEPGLYAIGDIVAGLPQLAHAAMMEGIAAVTHIAGKKPPPIVKDAHPERHVLRAADRFDRVDGKAGEGSRLRGEDRKVSVRRKQQSHDSRQPRRFYQGGVRRKVRRSAGHPHHRSAGNGNSGRGRGRAAPGGHDRRHDEHDACASHGLGRHGRRVRQRAWIADQRLKLFAYGSIFRNEWMSHCRSGIDWLCGCVRAAEASSSRRGRRTRSAMCCCCASIRTSLRSVATVAASICWLRSGFCSRKAWNFTRPIAAEILPITGRGRLSGIR